MQPREFVFVGFSVIIGVLDCFQFVGESGAALELARLEARSAGGSARKVRTAATRMTHVAGAVRARAGGGKQQSGANDGSEGGEAHGVSLTSGIEKVRAEASLTANICRFAPA